MKDRTRAWLEYAERDLAAARTLVAGGDYAVALFHCQQAIEKTLKALITETSDEEPPKIHGLLRLAEIAGVELPDATMELASDLELSYVESRYPDVGLEPEVGLDAQIIEHYVSATEETCQWLLSKIS